MNIPTACNEIIVKEFEVVKEGIGGIRTIRLQKNIAQKETLELQVVDVNPVATFNPVITKLCTPAAGSPWTERRSGGPSSALFQSAP